MSVKATYAETELTLVLDNGDRKKFDEVKQNWGFVDEQSMMRFMISVLISSDDNKTVGYRKDGSLIAVEPLDEHLGK